MSQALYIMTDCNKILLIDAYIYLLQLCVYLYVRYQITQVVSLSSLFILEGSSVSTGLSRAPNLLLDTVWHWITFDCCVGTKQVMWCFSEAHLHSLIQLLSTDCGSLMINMRFPQSQTHTNHSLLEKKNLMKTCLNIQERFKQQLNILIIIIILLTPCG